MADNRCALYIVLDTYSYDVKIGISKDPNRRLKEIANHYNVGKVQLIEVTWFLQREQAAYFERQFHKRYQGKHSPARGGREWFSLSEEDIRGFLEWMHHSSEQRAYKARTVSTTIRRANKAIWIERTVAFADVAFRSFFTCILPIIGLLVFQHPVGLFIPSIIAGGVAAIRVNRNKYISKTYGQDGLPISPELPVSALREMNLWHEEELIIRDFQLNSENEMPKRLKPLK